MGGIRLKQIKYTPDAADKLRNINRSILQQYGSEKEDIMWQLFGISKSTVHKVVTKRERELRGKIH